MFSTLVFIILTWAFIGFVFVGIGLFVQRIRGILAVSFGDILDSFWLGSAFLVFFLQLWNFWYPVNLTSFYILSVIGFAGILINHRFFLPSFLRLNIFFVLLVAISAIFLAGVVSLPFIHPDYAVYHSNLIQWAKSFHIVKGLGNLYGRLAFNNSFYLYVAWVDAFPWIKRSHHIVTGVFFMGLFIQILYSYFKVLKGESHLGSSDTPGIQHIFYVLMFWPVIFLTHTSHISTPAADAVVSMVQIILFAKMLVFLEQIHSSSKKLVDSFFFMLILLFLGICIKASMLPFGLSLLVISLALLFYKRIEINKTSFFISIGIGFLLGMVPCMLRNILVSGYIFYPMTFWGFPVAWKIPYAKSFVELQWVMSSARAPAVDYHQILGNTKWFWAWLSNNWKAPLPCSYFFFKIPLMVAMGGGLAILLGLSINKKIQWRKEMWLMFIPVLLSLIVWFFSAPDVRFAGMLFWFLSAWVLILAMAVWVRSLYPKIICTVILLSAVFYLSVETVKTLEVTINNARILKLHHVHIDSRLKLGPAFNDIFNDLSSEDLYFTRETDGGLILFTPIRGEDCWDKIPCTPDFNKNLRLIHPNDLSSGFVTGPS